MPMASASGVFATASRAASAVFVVAAILSTVPRASQAFTPCNYESVKTSGRVQRELRSHGQITSPGYPEAFPPCAEGMWSLVASPNCTVLLNFVEFDVANCTDHLFVYVMSDAPRVAAEISGKATNRTLQLEASNVQLMFLAQNDDRMTYGWLGEDGSAPPQPRRRFVIDFTSRPIENGSKGDQSTINRDVKDPYEQASAPLCNYHYRSTIDRDDVEDQDAPPAAGLSSSEASRKAGTTSKLVITVFVTVASVVLSAIILSAVYCILWRRTGHSFSYRRFYGDRSCSTAELPSDSATSTARREPDSSTSTSSTDAGCSYDGPNFLSTVAGSSVSPFAPTPQPKTTLATASV